MPAASPVVMPMTLRDDAIPAVRGR